MPDVLRLPESIQPFAFRNAIRVDSGQDFDNHIERLIRAVNGTLSSGTSRPAISPTGQPIPSPRFWRYRAPFLVSATLVLLIAALVGVIIYFRAPSALRPPIEANENDWTDSPSEWIGYGVDKQPITYYFKANSLEFLNDETIAYTSRHPFKTVDLKSSSSQPLQPTYEDDVIVLGCKNSVMAVAEKTFYNKAGEVISHYKKGDAKSMDLSFGEAIQPGSIIDTAERIFCNENLRSPIADDPTTAKTYISPLLPGKSDLYYSKPAKVSDNLYRTLLVNRFHEDQSFGESFPGQDVVALPHHGYRAIAEPIELKCGAKKIETPKLEYFDSGNKLRWIAAPSQISAIDVKDGSPLDMLLSNTCNVSSKDVSGTYEGTDHAIYKKGAEGDQKILIKIEQTGNQIKLTFQSANGGQGEGIGTLEGNEVKGISLKSTVPSCPGSYEGRLEFNDDSSMKWSYKGQDCAGPSEGQGVAKKHT